MRLPEVGAVGYPLDTLSDLGYVVIGGASFPARAADGELHADQAVVVVRHDDDRLVVRAATPAEAQPVVRAERLAKRATEPAGRPPIGCLRCNMALDYLGTKKFHEGTRAWGFLLGDIGELFVNREHFDVYVCPRCGRVEFFVDGVGEQFRPH